eukprot:GHUV01035501.1.p1 GENE.GHUV01035501.1~~GHUV01035501.1.p1  ORF type:complete len:136 (-),score=20.45 GHUV01035501.1:679-1086(-)
MDSGASGAASDSAVASCSSQADGQALPECYVIVYNVSKKHNVGTLLRSCTAFGVKEVPSDKPVSLSPLHSRDCHILSDRPVLPASFAHTLATSTGVPGWLAQLQHLWEPWCRCTRAAAPLPNNRGLLLVPEGDSR